jgi:hypothetical protein
MMDALGRRVLHLRRIRIGPLHLGTLGSGAFRELTPEEVDALYRAGTAKRDAAPAEPVIRSEDIRDSLESGETA